MTAYYPEGTAHDPRAPWNLPDDSGEPDPVEEPDCLRDGWGF